MSNVRLSVAHKVTIAALVLSAISVVIQKAMGVTNYPPVPPAIIITLGAAAALYFAPRKRWAAVIGLLVPLSLVVGMTIDKWYEELGRPDATGYPGIVLQWLATVLALIGAICIVAKVFRKS